MKSGVAAMIYAVKAVQDAGPFPGRIVVGALVDEEGLMLGAKHFAPHGAGGRGRRRHRLRAGGGRDLRGGQGRRTPAASSFTGAMAHGAMPQHARNPLPVAARVITGLERVQQRLQDEHGEHEHLGWTYLTPTVSLAGDVDQINVIPARATVCVDARTIPGVDHAAMVEAVTAMAREAAEGSGVRVDVEVVDDRPAVDTAGRPPGGGRAGGRARGASRASPPSTAASPAPPTARSSPATRGWRRWSTDRAASGSPTRPTSSSRSPTSCAAHEVYAEAARRFLTGSTA